MPPPAPTPSSVPTPSLQVDLFGANARKVIWFGLLGALGCAAGALLGEPLLKIAMPTGAGAEVSLASKPKLPSLDADTAVAVPPPPPIGADAFASGNQPPTPAAPELVARSGNSAAPPPPPVEFAQRLNAAGAKSGDVQISLIWFNVNDLDLHCVDPNGEHVFYGNRRSRSGGVLDVDMNALFAPKSIRPVENIYWPKGLAPQGKYKVYVDHFANYGGKDPSPFKVNVLVGGLRTEYEGEISRTDKMREICVFEVGPPGPSLQAAASPEIAVFPGDRNRLKVRIARSAFEGPVVCRVVGDLAGLSASEITIADRETEGSIEIVSEKAVLLGPRILSMKATGGKDGSLAAETSFRLSVRKPAAELRLAASPELILLKGGVNKLPIRIARSNVTQPIGVAVTGDLRGISAGDISLEPGADGTTESVVEVRADDSAPVGERTLSIVARVGPSADGGPLRTAAAFRLVVKDAPPSLRLSVPTEMTIRSGGTNDLPVHIARTRCPAGPVHVRSRGLGRHQAARVHDRFGPRSAGDHAVRERCRDRIEHAAGSRDRQQPRGGSDHADRDRCRTGQRVAVVGDEVLVIGFWTTLLAPDFRSRSSSGRIAISTDRGCRRRSSRRFSAAAPLPASWPGASDSHSISC